MCEDHTDLKTEYTIPFPPLPMMQHRRVSADAEIHAEIEGQIGQGSFTGQTLGNDDAELEGFWLNDLQHLECPYGKKKDQWLICALLKLWNSVRCLVRWLLAINTKRVNWQKKVVRDFLSHCAH